MTPTELKQAWLAKWRGMLDDNLYRMDHPEAHRVSCQWETRDMLEAGVIDEMEKLEMDELADAAYWHAVEEMVTNEEDYMLGGQYDVVSRSTSEPIGKIAANTYYSAAGPGYDGYDGKVFGSGTDRRLEFRHDNQPWLLRGLVLIAPTGDKYDLVQTAQVINGTVYPVVSDADYYRALVDLAQVAIEQRDFDAYRKARPLLFSARFTTCGSCLDRFGVRDDCTICAGNGFVPKVRSQPASSA